MLRPARPTLGFLQAFQPFQVRSYRPSAPVTSSGRRPIAVPVDPVPQCEISSPLDLATPAGSEPLPPPPHARSIAVRRSLLLFSLPIPPSSWPSHLEFASPLLAEVGTVLKRAGVSVNAVYDGAGNASFPSPTPEGGYSGTNTDADADTTAATTPMGEAYPATLHYADGKRFDFPSFSEGTLDSPQLRRALMYRPSGVLGEIPGEEGMQKQVLVCTHGARDCRCADYGSPLVTALRDVESVRVGPGGVVIREIAHVGGHKWAANALLLPSLDLLSNLRAGDAAALAAFAARREPTSAMWAHWRGRLGLDEAQQAKVWEGIQANFAPATAKGTGSERTRGERGERVSLAFRTFEGEVRRVDARVGDSLLSVAHQNQLPAMEGTCGGNAGECSPWKR
ncbi:hypothetical protein CspeluHIS016_0305860 [Cutaneotrichosporon spelunceum]|uniref:Sucrase/ferredoxin-like-domain-containing protein n=1 Tax=Cutaneotrichosporon spelunceum TaxID=1672016 RepID=A0AAD3TUH8_9TREE|nr:hypothetical protein CspeluHIS016_0305860 [Cutaneotrichosporon spelunceum]